MVNESQQAATNRLLYAMLKRQADVQAVCWHTSVSATDATGAEIGYEFVDHMTRAPRPTYTAVQAELRDEP